MTDVMAWRLGAGWSEQHAPLAFDDDDENEWDDNGDDDGWDDDDDEDWDDDWDDDDWDEEWDDDDDEAEVGRSPRPDDEEGWA